MERSESREMNEILGKKFPVLDDGFIYVVDYMGNDQSIVQAARVSYGEGTKQVHEDEGLIRYLMRHRHTTPFEMCVLKLHVRVPMDTWRQWVRHRMSSINEYSTRYSEAIDSAQKTKYEHWRLQSKSNKQGSESHLPFAEGIYITGQEEKLQKLAREVYEHRIFRGIAKEQARKDLPLSTYTEAYWKIDLHNLLHFLSLRMDSHAQKEIREYATIIGEEIVAKWCPLTWNAFKDYRMNSLNLSSREQEAIKLLLNYDDWQIILSRFKEFGWTTEDNQLKKTSRELNEFKEKLKKLDMYYLFDHLEGLL